MNEFGGYNITYKSQVPLCACVPHIDSFRQDAISLATISQIQDLSPTVKKLTLDSRHPAEVAFKVNDVTQRRV